MLSAIKKILNFKGENQEFCKSQADIFNVAGEDRLLDGWMFCATLQVRTPKKYLLLHRTVVPQEKIIQPREMWQGIWIPSVKKEFRLDIPNRTCASDVGPVSDSEYLPFLLKIRSLVEARQSINDRIDHIKNYGWTEQEKSYISCHGGIDALVEKFFPQSLTVIGFTAAQIAQLHERGICTPLQVGLMTDQDILSVKGVGVARLRNVREKILPLAAYDSSRIDSVLLD